MQSQTNHILGTDRCLIQNVAFRDSCHNTDHYLVMGCLCGAPSAENLRYLGNRARFPINPPNNPDGVYRLFVELRGGIPNPPWQERPRQAWILPET